MGEIGQEIEEMKDKKEKEEFTDKDLFILFAFIFRVLCLIVWIGTVIFCTYNVYLAAEEKMFWQRDEVMNPGPLSKYLKRGRDSTDFEWQIFIMSLATKLIYWGPAYILLTALIKYLCPMVNPVFSLGFTYYYLKDLIGQNAATMIFFQPFIYWLLLKFQSKTIIWVSTILFLILPQSTSIPEKITNDGIAEYHFVIAIVWTFSRCISFCMDTWNRKSTSEFRSLFNFYSYCFYFPVLVTGPLILYDEFESSILKRKMESRTLKETGAKLLTLSLKLLKFAFWIFIMELLLHTIYFRPLSLSIHQLYHINLWTCAGLIYWLGQFFMLKYFIIYGIAAAIAEYEDLPKYQLPRCIAYVHRYSVLWRDFDPGLYKFLIRYTYQPSLSLFEKLPYIRDLNIEIKKLCGSFLTFTYVFIWHSTTFEIFVWSLLNFIGITIEKIASLIKKKIDLYFEDHQNKIDCIIVWDFIVEPIVSIPLAIMSILNSVVFCGKLTTAQAIANVFWLNRQETYIYLFLYITTHVAVGIRTWPKFYPRLNSSFKKLSHLTVQQVQGIYRNN